MIDVVFYIKDCSLPSGVQTYVCTLSRELISRGISVEIVTDKEKSCNIIDIPVHSLDTRLDLLRFLRLRRYIKEKKPKLFISNVPARNPVLASLKVIYKHLNIACIYHLPPRRWNNFKKLVNSYFDSIIAVSSNVKGSLGQCISDKEILLLRNPFDFETIGRLAKEEVEEPLKSIFLERKVILNAGRFEDQKGITDLIDIFRNVRDIDSDAFLLLVGAGKQKNDILKKIKYAGLERDVLILNPVRNPFKYMARAMVFAFPTRYESLGRVVIESLYLGTPVVGFDSEGDYSYILSEYDLIVPWRDFNLFADKLIYILKEPWRMNLGVDAFGEYRADHVADMFISYFHRLLNDRETAHVFF